MNTLAHENPANKRLVCRADIKLDALTHNLGVLRAQRPNAEIVAMVKANAYGHGASIVAPHLEKNGVKWFGVSTVDEGAELRRAGVKARILVMSGSGAQFEVPELVQHKLTPLVSSLAELEHIAACVSEASEASFAVHLDVDTGMCRGGINDLDYAELKGFAKSVHIEGMSTHFAKAERADCEFTKEQVGRFQAHLALLREQGHHPRVVHVDKSASILTRNTDVVSDLTCLIRPGIALYGVDTTLEQNFEDRLQPVLEWRAPIVLRKSVPEGTPVGYDSTFVTRRGSEIALVRVGYADGLNRRLSNVGHMIVAGTRAPILGRISMDLSVVDVTDAVAQHGLSRCDVGNFAQIIGEDNSVRQSASDVAKLCETIPYEVLTWISARVERYAS